MDTPKPYKDATNESWVEQHPGRPTARHETLITLPVKWLIKLPGLRGEHKVLKLDMSKIQGMSKIVGDLKWQRKNPVTLGVQHDGKVFVDDGNHRIRAAKVADVDTLLCKVIYYGGGEEHFELDKIVSKEAMSIAYQVIQQFAAGYPYGKSRQCKKIVNDKPCNKPTKTFYCDSCFENNKDGATVPGKSQFVDKPTQDKLWNEQRKLDRKADSQNFNGATDLDGTPGDADYAESSTYGVDYGGENDPNKGNQRSVKDQDGEPMPFEGKMTAGELKPVETVRSPRDMGPLLKSNPQKKVAPVMNINNDDPNKGKNFNRTAKEHPNAPKNSLECGAVCQMRHNGMTYEEAMAHWHKEKKASCQQTFMIALGQSFASDIIEAKKKKDHGPNGGFFGNVYDNDEDDEGADGDDGGGNTTASLIKNSIKLAKMVLADYSTFSDPKDIPHVPTSPEKSPQEPERMFHMLQPAPVKGKTHPAFDRFEQKPMADKSLFSINEAVNLAKQVLASSNKPCKTCGMPSDSCNCNDGSSMSAGYTQGGTQRKNQAPKVKSTLPAGMDPSVGKNKM